MTIEEMKARIAEIDELLDTDITNDEFDKLEKEARVLMSEIGRIEAAMRLRSAKALARVSDWEASFSVKGEVQIDKKKPTKPIDHTKDTIVIDRDEVWQNFFNPKV